MDNRRNQQASELDMHNGTGTTTAVNESDMKVSPDQQHELSDDSTNIQADAQQEYDVGQGGGGTDILNHSLDAFTSILSTFHGTIMAHMQEAHELMKEAAELNQAVENRHQEEQSRLQQAMGYIESFQKRMFAEYDAEDNDDEEEEEHEGVSEINSSNSQHCETNNPTDPENNLITSSCGDSVVFANGVATPHHH